MPLDILECHCGFGFFSLFTIWHLGDNCQPPTRSVNNRAHVLQEEMWLHNISCTFKKNDDITNDFAQRQILTEERHVTVNPYDCQFLKYGWQGAPLKQL